MWILNYIRNNFHIFVISFNIIYFIYYIILKILYIINYIILYIYFFFRFIFIMPMRIACMHFTFYFPHFTFHISLIRFVLDGKFKHVCLFTCVYIIGVGHDAWLRLLLTQQSLIERASERASARPSALLFAFVRLCKIAERETYKYRLPISGTLIDEDEDKDKDQD